MSYTRDSVIQAAILAGYAFFGFLGALQITQIRAEPVISFLGGAILAGWTFFAFLAGKMLPGPPATTVPP